MVGRFLAAASLGLLPVVGMAADPEVEALLAKMRKAYSGAKSARIVTDVLVWNKQGEVNIATESIYLAPNKIRSVAMGARRVRGGLVTICDGKTLVVRYHDLPEERMPWNPEYVPGRIWGNLELLCLWDWRRQLSTDKGANMHGSKFMIYSESWSDRNWTVLEEIAEKTNTKARYFIDPSSSLIWRTVLINLRTDRVVGDFKCRSIELGAKIDPGRFKLPPEFKPYIPGFGVMP